MQTPAAAAPRRFEFAGLRLADLDLQGAVDWILKRAHAGRAAVVVTPNINHLHLFATSPEARAAIDDADLQLADGWPLIVASNVLGQPLPERLAGIDLVERLIDGDHSLRIAILGGPGGTAARLAERAGVANEVALVDELAPGWDAPAARSALLERVAASGANLVLIGIGAPRQELLAHELKAVAGGPLLGCGAAIEVLAGFRPRAPDLVQTLGLEWAFRLAIEPRRLLRRYVLSGWTFLRLLVAEMRRARRDELRARGPHA